MQWHMQVLSMHLAMALALGGAVQPYTDVVVHETPETSFSLAALASLLRP